MKDDKYEMLMQFREISFKQLEKQLKDNKENIKYLTKEDFEELKEYINISLDTCNKTQLKISYVENELGMLYHKINNYHNQINLTQKSIVKDNEFCLIATYLGILSLTPVASNNYEDYFTKVLILSLINTFAFIVNLLYIPSELRKNRINKKIKKLNEQITINEIFNSIYQKIKECYEQELDTEYQKLLELFPEAKQEEKKLKRIKVNK